MLQKDSNVQILLLQEPWFGTVATTRSDTDPKGHAQRGPPANPTWEMFLPQLTYADTCKAMAYVHKDLVDNHTVVHHPNHPLTTLHSVILDIFKDPTLDDMPSLQVVNVYYPPAQDHTLGLIFHHHINNTTLTLLIGNFNTHTPQWLMAGKTLSWWAMAFLD